MKNELADIIIRLYERPGRCRLKREDISFLLNASRRWDVLFVFTPGTVSPSFVIKATRKEENMLRLKNEFKTLRTLEAMGDMRLKGTFPNPLYEGQVKGHYLIVEDYARGYSLNEWLCLHSRSKAGVKKIFALAADWLISLHAATVSGPLKISEFLDGGFWRGTLEMYSERNSQGLPEECLGRVNALLEEARNLSECFIRPVFVHNDFSPYNILYDPSPNNISVIDWETAVDRAAPLVGLLNFFVVGQSVLRGYEETKNLRTCFSFSRNIHNIMPDERDLELLFYRDSWQNGLVSQNIQKYIRALGLDRRLLRLIFLLFILRHLNHSRGCLDFFLSEGNELRI